MKKRKLHTVNSALITTFETDAHQSQKKHDKERQTGHDFQMKQKLFVDEDEDENSQQGQSQAIQQVQTLCLVTHGALCQ